MKTKVKIEERLTSCNNRLDLYYKKEAEILEGGVQAYGIGSRSLSRYNADLSSIRKAISDLEDEIDALEAELAGTSRRKAVGVIIRDW